MGGSPELRLTRNEMCERLHVWEDELYGAPASGLHEWEVGEGLLYDDPAGGSHEWEDVSDDVSDVPDLEGGLDGFRDMDPDDSDGESLPETNDQDEFLGEMLRLLMERSIVAKDFCTVMWWASRNAFPGLRRYALRPGSNSGHYQRKLDKVIGVLQNSGKLMDVVMPGRAKAAVGRTENVVKVWPPHEAVDEGVRADPTVTVKLMELVDSRALPESYFAHPVVRANPDSYVLPIGLFIDAVPYSQTDSVIGVWSVNMVTGHRCLLAVIRKKRTCDCGCRGWCTFHSLFHWLEWSFAALARGKMPAARHDGRVLLNSDDGRKELAGQNTVIACLLLLKGDWSEYATTLGFPACGDGVRPCFGCNCADGTMFQTLGLTMREEPWRNNVAGDYAAACERCEIWVDVDRAAHSRILGLLKYNKSRDGPRGRALTADVRELGLREGDRLEPSAELLDVGRFEDLAFAGPGDLRRVLFWRRSNESNARHRNPIFSERVGIQPETSLTVDALHAVYLGCMKDFCRHLCWILIMGSIWRVHSTQEQIVEHGVSVLKYELRAWYRRRHRTHPREKLTRINDLTPKMLGESPTTQKLKTKAAETWGLLLFLIDFFTANVARLEDGSQQMLDAARALARMCECFERSTWVMDAPTMQEAMDAWKEHCARTSHLPELFTPKRHVIVHMLQGMAWYGNPRFYANWVDEGLNKTLKMACRLISQVTFEAGLLLRMPAIMHLNKERALRERAERENRR